jgi:simple sugar transport system permease protein
MNPLLKSILSTDFGFAILRVMTPLLFPAIGVAISGLSGAVNIALEGIMLTAACAGVLVSIFTKSLILAMLAGIAAGIGMAALLGYFHLKLKADIILAAIALNMFAAGITIVFLFLLTGDKGSTSSLKSQLFPAVQIPLFRQIPIVGPMLSGHNVLTYAALLSVLLFWIITFKTPLGLRIRAVGQNPDAAQSVGINVNRTRMYALLLSGFFGALGGLYLCMGYVSWFARDITAGRGFIAIAAASLGGNMPLGTFLSSLLFGAVNAVAIYLAPLKVPSEFIQMIPYLATAIALAIYSAQAVRRRRRRKSVDDAGRRPRKEPVAGGSP